MEEDGVGRLEMMVWRRVWRKMGQGGTITSGHSKLCKILSNLVSFSTSY